ncbi:COG1470 family protein [Hyunsoonleella rubra]|uniref:Ig-like domain-containing protein n=1 Tax=Hyunsoonleella rubra TaxID=1737062 RepID=A0ABW5TBV4_9FLAO
MRSTILSTLLVLTLLACSKEENHSEQQKIECNQLVLNQGTAYPSEKVFIEGIDEKQEDNLIVEFWYNDTFTEVSTSVGLDESGKSFIIAPVHPQHPIEGGELQVIVKNLSDELICNTKSITILELPEADGYTDKVTLGLKQLLKQRTDYLNIDEALLSGDLANIEPTDVPFAMLYNLLHNEDAEFALIPFLNNDKNWTGESQDKATIIDLTNRLLKKYEVLGHVNLTMSNFTGKQGNNTKDEKNSEKKNSERCKGVDAEDLASQMKSAANTEYSDPKNPTGEYFKDLSDLATITGLAPGRVGTAGDILSTIVFAIQKIEEAYSKTRLSHFTRFEVNITKTKFLEEVACPIPMDKAHVYAASNDWFMPKTIYESALQLASILSTRKIKQKEEGTPWKEYLEKHLNEYIEEFGFKLSRVFTIKQLKNLADQGFWENDQLKIEAIECGPIDVLNHKYIKANPLNNIFEADYKIDGGIEFYPVNTGKDVLEISLRPEYFSQQTISVTTDIELTPVELKWAKPTTNPHIIKPGDIVSLDAHLKNTINLDLVVNSPEGFLQAGEGVSLDTIQKFTLQTPTDPSKYPFTVTAEFKSTQCFRGTQYANPITAEIIINDSQITVYTDDLFGCFQVGDEKDFNVIVEGEDKEVKWSAQNESGQNFAISQEGIFTAPNEAGKYIIKAELQSNPEIFDTLEIEVVGACSCYWSYSTNEASASYDIAWYTVSDTGMDIRLHNDFDNILDEEIWIYIPNEFLPGEGETKVTSGTQTPQTLKMPIQCFNIKGGFGPTSFNATIKWKNQYLEANITGVFLSETDEGEEYDLPFTLIFGANEGILNCDGN